MDIMGLLPVQQIFTDEHKEVSRKDDVRHVTFGYSHFVMSFLLYCVSTNQFRLLFRTVQLSFLYAVANHHVFQINTKCKCQRITNLTICNMSLSHVLTKMTHFCHSFHLLTNDLLLTHFKSWCVVVVIRNSKILMCAWNFSTGKHPVLCITRITITLSSF